LASSAATNDVGIGEKEDDAVGRDGRAGAEDDFVDAALGARGDPGDFLGDEGAEAADLAEHLALGDGADPDEIAFDGGGGGFELREGDGDADEGENGDRAVDDALLAFGLGLVGARDVHACASICTRCASGGTNA